MMILISRVCQAEIKTSPEQFQKSVHGKKLRSENPLASNPYSSNPFKNTFLYRSHGLSQLTISRFSFRKQAFMEKTLHGYAGADVCRILPEQAANLRLRE